MVWREEDEVARLLAQNGVIVVLNLAAESHLVRLATGPRDFTRTNVVGTFLLMEGCRASWDGSFSGSRFHHVSSDDVYGSLGATGLFTETNPCDPNHPYSASKTASDALVWACSYT
jgi:dTDP-glucose 4,6-dehydratase